MPDVVSTSIADERGDPETEPSTASVEGAALAVRPSVRVRPRRSTGHGGLTAWPAVCSSCARIRSPGGGSRRSWIEPSTAIASRGPPSRSTIRSGAAPTARRRTATASGRGCSRTSPSTSSGRRRRHASWSVTAGSPRCRWRRRVRRAAGGRSSPRRGEHRPLHAVGTELIEELVAGARDALAAARADRPDRVPDRRPELGRAGGRADEPPLPGPVRPAPDPAPDRGGARRRRAVRHPRGRVPVLSPRPR